MADIICPQCREPWDAHHIRNDAFEGDEYDGRENMPPGIGELYDAWLDTNPWSGTPEEKQAVDALRLVYYNTGLARGCEACWCEPDRVLTGDAQLAALEDAIFNGGWDGDPAELFA